MTDGTAAQTQHDDEAAAAKKAADSKKNKEAQKAKKAAAAKKAAEIKKSKKAIGDGRFIPGRTRCRIPGCDHIVIVKGTKTRPIDNKRVVIERSVKCQGPGRHTYTHKEIVRR